MVLPKAGFIQGLRELCTKDGSLLILDETHTISTAHSGWAKAHNLPWNITRLGARLELQFCATSPKNALQARSAK